MLPILISVSEAPVSYLFCASAGVDSRDTTAAAASHDNFWFVIKLVSSGSLVGVRRKIATGPGRRSRRWVGSVLKVFRNATEAVLSLVVLAPPDPALCHKLQWTGRSGILSCVEWLGCGQIRPPRPGSGLTQVGPGISGHRASGNKPINGAKRMGSPFYTGEHEAFREVMRRFVQKEIEPHAHQWDEAG